MILPNVSHVLAVTDVLATKESQRVSPEGLTLICSRKVSHRGILFPSSRCNTILALCTKYSTTL